MVRKILNGYSVRRLGICGVGVKNAGIVVEHYYTGTDVTKVY